MQRYYDSLHVPKISNEGGIHAAARVYTGPCGPEGTNPHDVDYSIQPYLNLSWDVPRS